MLLGRARECEQLDRLLDQGRTGRSGALVLRGEAGIGKSALLGYAIERFAGMRVLRAKGIESEAEIGFAALSDLMTPLMTYIDRIPEVQAAALRAAMALGPPMAVERFTVSAATLSLLSSAAEDGPVLAVLDDAHWLDPSSAQAIGFAARRVEAEGIVLLFGLRDQEPTTFDPVGLPQLSIPPLQPDAAAALLSKSARLEVHPAASARILDQSAGNPLALIEISAQLSDDQLSGRQPLPPFLGAGSGLEQALQRRLRELSPDARAALLVAAASDSADLDVVVAALRILALDPSLLETGPARQVLVVDGDRLEWRHPLLRSALYRAAAPVERRAAHRALADSVGAAEPQSRRAWHLAAAAQGRDEHASNALEAAAAEARVRGAHPEAAATLERAARLTTAERRPRLLLQAAQDLNLAGRWRSGNDLLEETLSLTDDRVLRAEIQFARGWSQMWADAPAKAIQLFLSEAAKIEATDPGHAAAMLAGAAAAYSMTGEVRSVLAAARRAEAAARRAGAPGVQVAADLWVAFGLILCGNAAEGRPALARSRSFFAAGDPLQNAGLTPAGLASLWVEDYAEARDLIEAVVAAARRESAVGVLAYPLALLSQLEFRTGQWMAAYPAAEESMRLADLTGQENEVAFSLVCLARIEAGQGRLAECKAHISRATRAAESLGLGSILSYASAALGFLELGLGRPDASIRELERTADLRESQGLGEPGVLQLESDWIEALILGGQVQRAERALS